MTLGGNGAMVVIERKPGEGQEKAAYYMEIIDWGVPDDVRLAAEHDSMKQGTAQTLSLQSNAQYEMLPAWSSSDHRILSVTQSGYPGGGDDDDPWWNPWPWWNDDEDGDNDNIDGGNIDDENGGGNHVAHNPGTEIEYKRILFRVTGKIRLHARAEKSHAA